MVPSKTIPRYGCGDFDINARSFKVYVYCTGVKDQVHLSSTHLSVFNFMIFSILTYQRFTICLLKKMRVTVLFALSGLVIRAIQ